MVVVGVKGYFTECQISRTTTQVKVIQGKSKMYNIIQYKLIIQTNCYDDYHTLKRIGTLVSKLMHISNTSFWETSQRYTKSNVNYHILAYI